MELTTGLRVLMGQIADSAHKMGFSSSRVDVRVNARGELVIAVLIPPRHPDEWGPPSTFAKRQAATTARHPRG
jgi:hypothetical protein